MDNGEDDRRNLWLSVSKSLGVSAWLPPGLALGWLAALATLVHDVALAVAYWGATVSLAVLSLLVARLLQWAWRRRQASPAGAPSGTGAAQRVAPRAVAGASGGAPVMSELRVATAEEVASVLGVEERLVISSIRDGQFPGNQIGNHWLVDEGAVARWLRGSYREPAAEDPRR
jgi:excisionase family DNA binding protein